MKTVRQLNIRDKQGHFFTDMININNFDSGLLHVDRKAFDHDFIVSDIKYVKNLNEMDCLYIFFNDLDVMFRKSGKNKYLIFSLTEKNKLMLENYTEIFDEIAEQIESISDDFCTAEVLQSTAEIMRIKFKTNHDLMFNEIINIPVCVIVISSISNKKDEYYP